MQRIALGLVLFSVLLVEYVHAHLVLTYPPARDPKYDYLDNYRKGGPCGIPGRSVKGENAESESTRKALELVSLCSSDALQKVCICTAILHGTALKL